MRAKLILIKIQVRFERQRKKSIKKSEKGEIQACVERRCSRLRKFPRSRGRFCASIDLEHEFPIE